jgi:hypothetical protein
MICHLSQAIIAKTGAKIVNKSQMIASFLNLFSFFHQKSLYLQTEVNTFKIAK